MSDEAQDGEYPDYVPIVWSAEHRHDHENYWCLACFFEDPYLSEIFDVMPGAGCIRSARGSSSSPSRASSWTGDSPENPPNG